MEPITTPTQTRHPWRATLRTVFAVAVALATLIPYVATSLNVETEAGVAQVVAVAAGITRVLALPHVEAFLERFLPFLAASPADQEVN